MYAWYAHRYIYIYIYMCVCVCTLTGESVCVVHVCSEEEVERVGRDGHAEGLIRELYIYIYICMRVIYIYAYIYPPASPSV